VTELTKKTNPDIQLAKEAVPILRGALKIVSREESVGGEGEADVSRLGDVERCQGQLAVKESVQQHATVKNQTCHLPCPF
jgi:hypothetical protein